MSTLRSLIDEMRAVDHSQLSVEELHADVVELTRSVDQFQVLITEKTAVLDERGGLNRMGFPSITTYLMFVGGMTAGRARRYATRIKARLQAPLAYRAWADGRLSTDQAHVLFYVAESVPDEFADAEERLVEIVEPLSVRDTSRAMEYWRQSVDGPGDLDLESQMLRRGLSLSGTVHGMRRIDGWLTQLAGDALETALSAHMPPPSAEDDRTRTARQRRHDALEDLVNCHLTHADTPIVGGEKPHLQVLTDLDGLNGIAGGTHETLNSGEILDVEAVRLIACDSSISRVVLGPDSEIIDVGRKTRVWSAAQRRAITARDRTCTWDDCERHAKWCDKTFPRSDGHLRPWIASGGKGASAHVRPLSARIPRPDCRPLPRWDLCEAAGV